ncbi:MAG: D-alanine--D-alanine ligase [Nitrospiraceae bacterium]|nr:D-alanine--D-alanine ligase [Nitrospiraceae bacterium]
MVSRFARVAVLYGGDSPEAEVSRMTGEGVLSVLSELSVTATGMEVGPGLPALLAEFRPDACFLATHGGKGENGALQGLLEVMEIPYTGTGVLGSALGMSKSVSRKLFRSAGLVVPETIEFSDPDLSGDLLLPFPYPVIVKPESAGSSIGILKVDSPEHLRNAISDAMVHSSKVLVEPFLSGREIQVGLLAGEPIGIIEVVPDPGEPFYTFSSKYQPGGSRHIFPAVVSKSEERSLNHAARVAWEVLELRGVARLDTILMADGHVVVLEMNTLPGMTKTSLLPEIAMGMGISFPDLVCRILNGACLDSLPVSQIKQ